MKTKLECVIEKVQKYSTVCIKNLNSDFRALLFTIPLQDFKTYSNVKIDIISFFFFYMYRYFKTSRALGRRKMFKSLR